MTDSKADQPGKGDGWDLYWQGTEEAGDFSLGGVSHPAIRTFWQQLFHSIQQQHGVPGAPALRMLDVAAGNGALVKIARAAFGVEGAEIHCIDLSPASIANIKQRFPGVEGLVADVAAMPVSPDRFDLVVSQFGVDYAGIEGIVSAARTVASGGLLAALLHYEGGTIQETARQSRDAVTRLRESRFVPLARQMFEAAFAAVAGAAREPYDEAARSLQPAIDIVEAILREHGPEVAEGTVAYLHENVARMHEGLVRFDRDEVIEWLSRMEFEVNGYLDRMSAMCDVAVDAEGFEQVCEAVSAQGLSVVTAEPLALVDGAAPLAWVLVAVKEAAEVATVEGDARNAGGRFRLMGEEEVDRAELRQWIKQQVDRSMSELMTRGVVESRFLEARAAWVLPFQILLGRARRPQDSEHLLWFICGEPGLDHVPGSAAATPRDAARYFSLKWQLEAEREGENGDRGARARKVEIAEALYELADNDALWR